MASRSTIRLTVPGTLAYRGVAVRVVAEACRLVTASDPETSTGGDTVDPTYDLRDPFDTAVVSAFAEVYNNIAIHAYQRQGGGDVEVVIEASRDGIQVEVVDTGQPFDIDAVPEPDLDGMPEGGMGIHIARTMLDEVSYQPGPPNLWKLVKRAARSAA
jgi:serine/threonine-protein kinase RsbW